MIRLDSISKQNGHQLLFIDALMAVQKGEKVGLVGPNGAGKTTIFRMISGQEPPDDGAVLVEGGMTIGYFSQDVGEMSGRTAVAAVMDGAGPVSALAAEMATLEAAMVDLEQADDMDALITRYGEVQERFEDLGGYGLEERAREVLAGLSFSQERMDADVGLLSGGWKMRVELARILLMQLDGMLLDEPSNHLDLESLIWLEDFLKRYDGALLMTSHDREFMNRIVNRIVEIDGGQLTTYSGNYGFYEQQRALTEKQRQAQFERQQAMLAKEIKFIERFKARASHAAQVQSRVKKLDKIERVEPPRVEYFAADKLDADAIARCFASGAVVKDEGHTYTGVAAIKQWKTATAAKYIYTCEPLSAEQKDGTTVVTCHLEGNFPGGRADLRFFFRLERGKIANLEIIP